MVVLDVKETEPDQGLLSRAQSEDSARLLMEALDASFIDSSELDFEIETVALGTSHVSKLRLGPTWVEAMRAPLDEGTLHFLFITRGEVEFWDGKGVQMRLGTGDAAVIPAGYRLHARTVGRLEFTAVSLASSNLAELLPNDQLTPLRLSTTSALLAPSLAFVDAVFSGGEAPVGLAQYASERIAHELLSTLVLDTEGFNGPVNGANEQIRERAIAYIAEEKNDPSLSVERLAASVSVSVRHLQRIFREAGTTVSKEIRRQRAWAAHSVLSRATYDVLSISQVAERSGFTDTKDLRRAMLHYFDKTPRQVRQERRR